MTENPDRLAPEWMGGFGAPGFCTHCQDAHGTRCNSNNSCACPCNDPRPAPGGGSGSGS